MVNRKIATKMMRRALCCVAFFLMHLPAVAQLTPFPAPLQKLSLNQAVTIALQKNPGLTRLKEEKGAAKARQEESASGFRPRLTLEALEKDGPSSAPSFGFSGLANSTILQNYGASVVLSQMIYDFGHTLHLARAETFALTSSEAHEKVGRAYVILNVYKAYADTLLAMKLLELAKENQAYWELTVKQAKAKLDAGLTSRVDVDLANGTLAEAKVQRVNAHAEIDNAFAELHAVMGADGSTPYLLTEFPDQNRFIAIPQDSPGEETVQALRNRPEMQDLEAQIQSLHEAALAAKASGLPVVRGLASGGYDHVTAGALSSNHTYAVGLGISYPFYTGGSVEASVAMAEHRLKALEAAREELKQKIRLEVIKARLTLFSLAESKEAIQEELQQAKDSVSLSTERYKEGLGNILEVQQSLLALLTAKTNAARLHYDTVTAFAAFQYALGNLDPLLKGAP